MKKQITLVQLLMRLGACSEAIGWAESLGPDHPADETAWQQCPRGDWMLWVAGRLNIPRATLVLGACACARQVLVHVKVGEDRPRIAIETAESWARGGEGAATIEQVRQARDAAAAYAAAAADAAYAVYAADAAAAYAVYAADAAAAAYAVYAAYAAAAYAVYAADAAAYAVYAADAADAAADDARKKSLARSAELVREVIEWSVLVAEVVKLAGGS